MIKTREFFGAQITLPLWLWAGTNLLAWVTVVRLIIWLAEKTP